MRQFEYMPEIEEFKSKGFIQNSGNMNLLIRLRVQYGEYFRIFKTGTHGCGYCNTSKNSSLNIFGHRLHYYYDIRRKDDFVKYLVEKFYKKNPMADRYTRREFTMLLHSHGLCWKECYCEVEKNKKENKNGMT